MVKAQSARKRRGSNTKGRKIQHVDPLQRGQACDICRQRRVRCSGDEPCTACLRVRNEQPSSADFHTNQSCIAFYIHRLQK